MQNKLRRLLHKKERQKMDDFPVNTATWSFFIKDPQWIRKTWLFVSSAVLQYICNVEEDWFVQIPSLALAWTFWAGACGARWRRSNTLTATWWTTSTITLSTTINNLCVWRKLRFLTWSNTAVESVVSDVKIIPGWTTIIYLSSPLPNAVANGETFRVWSWMYYIMNAWAIAAWIFRSYDPLTWLATSLWTTNLVTRWTEWRLVWTPSYYDPFATWTATSWTVNTIVNSAKTRTTNQRSNYQVRITSWTGAWQVRTISSNTATALTVSSNWTVNPDATSVYAIEGNDDFLYLMGNNNLITYRYSISANTWTVLAPTVARWWNLWSWGWANWIWKTWSDKWSDENAILDWRYIFSYRGGWTSLLDRYDIALNRWDAIAYIQNWETFTTWSSYDTDWSRIYIKKESTWRYFYYDVVWNIVMPFARNMTPEGAAIVWDKMFTVTYRDAIDNSEITRLYVIFNTSNLVYRIMVI